MFNEHARLSKHVLDLQHLAQRAVSRVHKSTHESAIANARRKLEDSIQSYCRRNDLAFVSDFNMKLLDWFESQVGG